MVFLGTGSRQKFHNTLKVRSRVRVVNSEILFCVCITRKSWVLYDTTIHSTGITNGGIKMDYLGWQLSDCGFCQWQLITKSAIT